MKCSSRSYQHKQKMLSHQCFFLSLSKYIKKMLPREDEFKANMIQTDKTVKLSETQCAIIISNLSLIRQSFNYNYRYFFIMTFTLLIIPLWLALLKLKFQELFGIQVNGMGDSILDDHFSSYKHFLMQTVIFKIFILHLIGHS